MISQQIKLWGEGEYYYPLALGFEPNIVSYIHEEDEKKRPCMLVVPGGGYCVVSPTEAEIVAKEFYHRGYNAFVLTYTTNILARIPLKEQPMKDLSRAIRIIRKNADEFHIDSQKLAICGFSAGGHLSASICVHFEDVLELQTEYGDISNRPDAAILCYPVITSGEKAHRGSFFSLLGEDATPEELHYMSLETQVKKNTPPCFIWQTATDADVPVENSYLFAKALQENGVPYCLHIFPNGRHGLSLANEIWARGEFGDPYTEDQTRRVIEAVLNGSIPVEEEQKKQFLEQRNVSEEELEARRNAEKPNRLCRQWPDLAHTWLDEMWSN